MMEQQGSGANDRMRALREDLRRTAAALANGFRIADIATFPVATCDVRDEIELVRRRFFGRFDYVPVKDGASVVGVLEVPSTPKPGALVEQIVQRLTDDLLVEENASLLEVLESLTTGSGFRLVLRGSRVEGIVTASDLLKLPVRALAFSYITHLERVMAAVVGARFRDSAEWFGELNKKRRREIRKKQDLLGQQRRDPDLIELTDFCDKRELVKRRAIPKGKKGRFEKDLKAIESLRNDLAHAAKFVRSGQDLDRLPRRLKAARSWAEWLVQEVDTAADAKSEDSEARLDAAL